MKLARDPFLLAFSTASSEAALPTAGGGAGELPDQQEDRRLRAKPMGYSFNLDGSMMYATFATLFLAQAYGVSISPSASRWCCCWC
ncbi:MAG: cation:dicarboxylase symporter family transporter [Rhodospirillales bacterium]